MCGTSNESSPGGSSSSSSSVDPDAGASGVASGSWDWNGVLGTGQSLSVGTPPLTSVTQPYGNLKLSLGARGNRAVPPWDPAIADLAMVPLVEPIRPLESGYPSPYPGNVYGETPHSAMANQITGMVKGASPSADYVTVHTVVGESGQGIDALVKDQADTRGPTGRAYAASLFEAAAITRLAKAAGKSYGISVVVMTHGETDAGNSSYGDELVQLLSDYNADLSAITGQTRKIPMYLSQQHAYPNGAGSRGRRPAVNQLQWQLGVQHPGDFVCTGPKYQYPGDADGVHLTATGYQLLGEKVAEIYTRRVVQGANWQPLMPTTVERNGRVVTVHFNVPVPPLSWDTSLDAPSIAEWVKGRGFELRTMSSNIVIDSVDISGDAVSITAGADLPTSDTLVVGYAMASQGVQMVAASHAVRWGQLRDSDPFVGSTTNLRNPNYGVSFELVVPTT